MGQSMRVTLPAGKCFRRILGSGLYVLRGRRVGGYPFVPLAAMHSGVACRTQRDQVFL